GLCAAPEWPQVLDRGDASVHKHLLGCWSTACLLDDYGVRNGARETGEGVFDRLMLIVEELLCSLHILSACGREWSYRCRAASQPSTCPRVTAQWPRGWPAFPDRRWVQFSLLGLR